MAKVSKFLMLAILVAGQRGLRLPSGFRMLTGKRPIGSSADYCLVKSSCLEPDDPGGTSLDDLRSALQSSIWQRYPI